MCQEAALDADQLIGLGGPDHYRVPSSTFFKLGTHRLRMPGGSPPGGGATGSGTAQSLAGLCGGNVRFDREVAHRTVPSGTPQNRCTYDTTNRRETTPVSERLVLPLGGWHRHLGVGHTCAKVALEPSSPVPLPDALKETAIEGHINCAVSTGFPAQQILFSKPAVTNSVCRVVSSSLNQSQTQFVMWLARC